LAHPCSGLQNNSSFSNSTLDKKVCVCGVHEIFPQTGQKFTDHENFTPPKYPLYVICT